MDVTDSDVDDPDIRVMKVLLRASRPLHGDMSAFDPNAYGVTILPENVRENLVGLLNRLVREETAYLDGKGIYVIENQTLMEVESRLETALKQADARAKASAEKAAHNGAAAFASPNIGGRVARHYGVHGSGALLNAIFRRLFLHRGRKRERIRH